MKITIAFVLLTAFLPVFAVAAKRKQLRGSDGPGRIVGRTGAERRRSG